MPLERVGGRVGVVDCGREGSGSVYSSCEESVSAVSGVVRVVPLVRFFFFLYLLEELACNQLKAPYHTGVGSARPLQAPYFVFFFIVRLRPDPQELALPAGTVF